MKISELIPSKLPGIVIRTIQGLMTGEDHDYLKKYCRIDVLDSWFCDDKSIELEIKLEDGTIKTIDLSDVENLELANYQEIVYYTLISHAGSQLPDWVYEADKFHFDWSAWPNLSPQEYDTAHEKVWNIVFNGEGPEWWRKTPTSTWCAGKDALTPLEADILRTMFGINGCQQDDPLPTWLGEEAHGLVRSFPMSRELIKDLEDLFQIEDELTCAPTDQQTDSDGEPYVSPFTGQSV